jgi:hypothetical protein
VHSAIYWFHIYHWIWLYLNSQVYTHKLVLI